MTGAATANTKKKMAAIKAGIRQFLHPQIKQYWLTHPATQLFGTCYDATFGKDNTPFWEHYGNLHKQVSVSNHVHKFAPLITHRTYHGCAINALFLRRDMPNTSLIHQGDLDNRLKVLFDSLRMRRNTQEVHDVAQAESPCFCLLEDDRYIDHISVTTDRLLVPVEENWPKENVLVIIHVIANILGDERFFDPLLG